MEIIDNYILSIPSERRERAEALHRTTVRIFPKVKVSLFYKMPTYHIEEQFFAWGNKKNYLSLYTCSSLRIAEFKQLYPSISTGVGCINIKNRDGFPLEVIEQVIRNALAPGDVILEQEAKAMENSASKKRKAATTKHKR